MTVIKRDGRKVPFDSDRIKTAIKSAMKRTAGGVDEDLAAKISGNISKTSGE